MLLIADSGSTKTDWALCCDGRTEWLTMQGLNPYQMSGQEISYALRERLLPAVKGRGASAQVFFYGAGCTPSVRPVVQQALSTLMPEAHIEVADDLLAAARALLGHRQGIAAILGTGANSCFYDGERVALHIPPLGYILGDEGSGAYLGKQLSALAAKRLLEPELTAAFWRETQLTEAILLQRVYRASQPNRFLAGLVPFIAAHRQHPQIKRLLKESFTTFFNRNIAPYGKAELPVNFVGGIAHSFEAELRESAAMTGYNVGLIEQRPLPRLVDYHMGREEKH